MKHAENEKSIENEIKDKAFKNLIALLMKLSFLLFAILFIFGFCFGLKRMPTSFMSPRITEGDLLLFYRLDKNYKLNDVVLVKYNDNTFVARIVATSGQTVQISEDEELLINGYPEENTAFFPTKINEESSIHFPYIVNANEFFVMNDYRLNTEDSRTLGAIPASAIKGKIFARIQIRDI